jgi:hypothetical protein
MCEKDFQLMSVVHPNKQAFVQGVHLIFSKWTALKLAVSMDWSDDGLSEEKREWFEQVIVDYFGKRTIFITCLRVQMPRRWK